MATASAAQPAIPSRVRRSVEANAHDARIGVGCATQLRGFQRPIGEFSHHGFMDDSKEKISTQSAQKSQRTTEKSTVLFPLSIPLPLHWVLSVPCGFSRCSLC